jgi:uncharacterized damage-inducible protein DinB
MTGDERAVLTGFLDYQRATLLWKCEQLDADALLQRGVPPSSLSLLGIVRHMAVVEWHWFEKVFSGSAAPSPISLDPDRDADFNDLNAARAMEDIELFGRQCDDSRAVVAATASLSALASRAREPISLRWILVHMIEEYARHNGHADLLRERIDGAVGE